MTDLEKQLESVVEFLEWRLGTNHKETVAARSALTLEWIKGRKK